MKKGEKSEDLAEVYYEKPENRNIICLTYQQSKAFEGFKETQNLVAFAQFFSTEVSDVISEISVKECRLNFELKQLNENVCPSL